MSELVAYYKKLSSSFISLEIQHFGSEKVSKPNDAMIEKALKKEAEKIDKYIKPSDSVILMSEHAKSYSTLDLQKQFEAWLDKSSRVCFIFGSAYGLHSSLYQPNRLKLSLSPLTMQHELALVVWMEQLYRLMTLKAGKRYHY
jgi:23S rRNA (pseudouridine1915-N3)-methyltransferase